MPGVAQECIQYLRKSGPEFKISVEVERPTTAGLQELAAEADVVFYSATWARVCDAFTLFRALSMPASWVFTVADCS